MKLNELLNAYRAELDSTPAPNLEHLFSASVPAQNRAYPRIIGPVFGLAAAAALALVFWPTATSPVREPSLAAPHAPEASVAPTVAPVGTTHEALTLTRTQARKMPTRARKLLSSPAQVEVARFVALPDAELLPEPNTYQLMRIRLDENRLISLGLRDASHATGRLVSAQVLLGDDGLARAIRLLGEDRE